LSRRGIRLETARQFHLGYDPAWISPTALLEQTASGDIRESPDSADLPASPRLILPASHSTYVAFDVRPDMHLKDSEIREGPPALFHVSVLKEVPDSSIVFVAESEFDALSIQEIGKPALALGNVKNAGKLLSFLHAFFSRSQKKIAFVLCLSHASPGRETARNLLREMLSLRIPCIDGSPVIYQACFDWNGTPVQNLNDFLQMDRDSFFCSLQKAELALKEKPDNMKDYMSHFLAGEVRRFTGGLHRKTGFSNLDAAMEGIYPGLYVLGAISSLGKTTFFHQMADQMAAAGEHVLFFSLEQSRLELASKSLSRLTARIDFEHASTSLEIRSGVWTPLVSEAKQTYLETIGDRLSIIEGNLTCHLPFLEDYITRYRQKNHVQPVVILDYLQILQGDPNGSHGNRNPREAIDTNVTELKRLSRTHDIPIFLVSSLNRGSYLTPVAFESFKESGGIEYTADVVWGLQLTVMHEDLFQREGLFSRKRKRIQEAKKADPRSIDLICLKNRYGVSDYTATFHYYPKYDLFIPYQPDDWDLPETPPADFLPRL